MQYSFLGKTGMKVSRICLGTMTYGSKSWRDWVLEADEARPFFEQALEAGINFFDTADLYDHGENEVLLGLAAREIGRDKLIIASL